MFTLQICSCLLLLVISWSQGVKFNRVGVTVDGGVFRVGDFTSMSCNYIKWKQETVNKVIWTVGGSGSMHTLFVSHYDSGQKEIHNNNIFAVDKSSSGERVVRIKVNEAPREAEVTVCCEVEAIRDSGYGVIKKVDKGKCTQVVVLSGEPMELHLDVNKQRAQVGDRLQLTCEADHSPSATELEIQVNDVLLVGPVRGGIIVTNLTVVEDHFSPVRRALRRPHRTQEEGESYIVVDCLARHGEHILTNSTVFIDRYQAYRPAGPVNTLPPARQTQLHPQQLAPQARNARQFWTDRQSHGNHGKVPCHAYLILEEGPGKGSVLRGELSQEILNYLQTSKTADRRYETEEEAVTVLNVLGYNGYTVVGMAREATSLRLVWTLERKYFEFHDEL